MFSFNQAIGPIRNTIDAVVNAGVTLAETAANVTSGISPMAGQLINDSADTIAPYVKTFSKEFVAAALQDAMEDPEATLYISMMFFNPAGDKKPFLEKYWGIALQSAGVAVLGTGSENTTSQTAVNESMEIKENKAKEKLAEYINNDPEFRQQAKAKRDEWDAMFPDDEDFAKKLKEFDELLSASSSPTSLEGKAA